MQARPEFGENVRGGGEIFRGGGETFKGGAITMILPSQQRVETKNTLLLYFLYMMSACLVVRNLIKQQTLIFAKAGIYGAKLFIGAKILG